MTHTPPLTVETLRPEHIADLRALAANPQHAIQPIRRRMLKQLGLIVPTEPPRQPSARKIRQPARRHALTDLGARVIAGLP